MKYEELNEEQKAAALDTYRHTNVDFDEWDDCLREEFANKVSEYGFDDITISADTSFCQGSGASFTCDSINIIQYLIKTRQLTKYRKLKKLIVEKELTGKIERTSHHYNHSNTVDSNLIISYYLDVTDAQDDLLGELQKDIIEWVRRECDAFHRKLENYYMEETSDERVEESIFANDYDFEIKDNSVTYL